MHSLDLGDPGEMRRLFKRVQRIVEIEPEGLIHGDCDAAFGLPELRLGLVELGEALFEAGALRPATSPLANSSEISSMQSVKPRHRVSKNRCRFIIGALANGN